MEGAFNFHLKFSADAAAVGVGNPIPSVTPGGVAVEPFRVCDAGSDRGCDRTVTGNAGSVEVIEEDYHDGVVTGHNDQTRCLPSEDTGSGHLPQVLPVGVISARLAASSA